MHGQIGIVVRGTAGAIGAAVLLAWIAVPGLAAQDVQRIAAIVNDEVVSGYDVESRLQLVLRSSDVRDTPENRRRLRRQILRSLVDERLQVQEANRYNVKVTDADLERAKRAIARQNRIPTEQLDQHLARRGIGMDALLAQIKAEIAWGKLLRRRLQPEVQVSEDEVDEVLERLKANAGKPEHRVSEIFLPIDSGDQEDEVRRGALRLIEQIKAGASFNAIARQFSRGATARAGGQVGWIQPGQLSEELDQVLQALPIGEISAPVRTTGGYYILRLHERRRILEANPLNTKVTLKQIMFPVPKRASPAEVASQQDLAGTVAGSVRGCDQVEAVGKELTGTDFGTLGTVRMRELPPQVRAAIAETPVGTFSSPLNLGGNIVILMVCERDEPASKPPTREQVSIRLTRQRLATLAQRYLRDLRRAAVVELR